MTLKELVLEIEKHINDEEIEITVYKRNDEWFYEAYFSNDPDIRKHRRKLKKIDRAAFPLGSFCSSFFSSLEEQIESFYAHNKKDL